MRPSIPTFAFTLACAVLLVPACDSPVGGGPAGDGGAEAGSPFGGSGNGGSGGGAPSAADRTAFNNYATKFVGAACTQALDCGLTPSLAGCVSEAEAELAGYASCDDVITYYKKNRAALEACLTATPSCEALQSDGLCAAADGLDSAAVSCADAGTGGGGGGDGGGLGSDAGSDAGGGGSGSPLTTDQAAVGAWAGGATCTDGVDTFQISFALLVCPGGRLRGAEVIDSFEFVDCGTWSTSGADLSLDYTATAVADPTFTDATTADFSYDVGTDSLEWFSSCQLTLARVPGTLTEEDCESSVCSAGGTGPVSCGTECDCGRCWYCESGTCRYGGEGDFGCYRGCGE